MIANTPNPPYYAVIFTTLRNNIDDGYVEMARRMVELAKQQPGFLGEESARDELGITVSYWESLEAMKEWKQNIDHLQAQKLGKEKWYKKYKLRVVHVVRDAEFGF
ncbi:antibiotic biosynthesis monooxygenase family protein [Draconibacterium halophilum]|uniref:Antibiotic biosynthesis monooxygenase n=1 Tax=Draconibacterium halophilum TaxID=2706887 RepID=A0A6C0RA52_9BACT|nr:antibiotic biosynthesis monooxygenase [Draconibacterium halophilum]QIA07274.1 antibiotic biosynthesis monooxygenase [Draconibacterium halophilum]